MRWAEKYIGIPFRAHGRDWDGCDCWGLVRLVYATELGLALPSLAGEYDDTADVARLQALVRREAPRHQAVAPADIQPCDVLVFRRADRHGGWAGHVGVAVDAGQFLHTSRALGAACIERLDGRWAHRLLEVYRHGG